MTNRNFYRNPSNGVVYEYDDHQVQSGLVLPGLVKMTSAEVAAHLSPAMTPDDHRAGVAAERYRRETAGIAVAGMQIDTGRDSQALITGAALAAMLDPNYVCRWKTSAGFVELSTAQIIAVATAVRAHVQGCFDREAALLNAIADGTYAAEMLEEGWPDDALN